MADCGCGRSPTGKCMGWHALTEEQYQEKKAAYEAKKALDEFEANLVEEVILTLPISRYFEPDDEGDLATVHTSIVSAHETLVEIDALYIRLTDIAQGIKEGHV